MFSRYGVVYKITNLINGKCYVGKTKTTIQLRWTDHKKPSALSCSILKRAINKHGCDSFSIEEIATCFSKDDLNATEKFLIKQHNTMHPNGYNLRAGGEGGEFSELTRKKLSDAQKGIKKRPKTQDEKENLRQKMLGRLVSKETRSRLSKALKGRIVPKNGVCSTPLVSYDVYTKEITEFPSIAEADRAGFINVCVYRSLRQEQPLYKNRLWFYKSEFNEQNLQTKLEDLVTYFLSKKGVRVHKKTGLFQARIKVNKKELSLGYFNKFDDARTAYIGGLMTKFSFLKDLI